MGSRKENEGKKGGKKERVAFRPNRAVRRRKRDWTQRVREADDLELDADRSETVVAKGDVSRRRTVIASDEGATEEAGWLRGTVVAVRGLYVDVDDGKRVVPCTVRRVLRTRLIEERSPVTVGDRVRFCVEGEERGGAPEGVIQAVEPRQSELRRFVRRRVHTMVANVDQAIIVSSAAEPLPKPHLIDRYIVAALAGEITPVVCMNKMDLDRDGPAGELLHRFGALGYRVLPTSAVTGEGINELRGALKDRSSVIAGQSGVGKSSLLNAVQPGLRLKVGDIIEQTSRGRHTTTTATLIRLVVGGYVVDTPGIRTFDLSMVGKHELEAYFVEFLPHVPNCKFPDCTHIHEGQCAVKAAVGRGEIHDDRYESYVRMFEEPGA